MKKAIKLSAAVLAAALFFYFLSIFSYGIWENTEIREYTVEGEKLTVGIMSDIQLTGKKGEAYEMNLRAALALFKSREADMIISAGDSADFGRMGIYEQYGEAFRSVYPEGERPITVTLMGNHEYYINEYSKTHELFDASRLKNRFESYMGENSAWTHTVVNGMHFIGCSPSNKIMGAEAYEPKLAWLEEQIRMALRQSPEKPVFVITHLPPKGTVNGGVNGIANLNELLKKYPNVICISAHTHESLMDERSVWQGEYTAINSQGLSYVYLQSDRVGDIVQENRAFIEENPMAMIMEITEKSVTVRRYSVLSGQQAGSEWVIDLPINPQNFRYRNELRSKKTVPPEWQDFGAVTLQREGEALWLTFSAAQHPEAVHWYKLEFLDSNGKPVSLKDGENGNYLMCVSDFARGRGKTAETVKIDISEYVNSGRLGSGRYTVRLHAVETFGKASEARLGEITI